MDCVKHLKFGVDGPHGEPGWMTQRWRVITGLQKSFLIWSPHFTKGLGGLPFKRRAVWPLNTVLTRKV